MKNRMKHELRMLYSTEEQTGGGKRITGLDMVKGIAIFLVVLGHSGTINHMCNTWLSTFHLPAFFFVSGILMQMKSEEELSAKILLKKKITGIMIPYLWFSVGAIPCLLFNIYRGNLGWEVLKQLAFETITLQGYSVMWFLPVLFLAELFLLLLLKGLKHLMSKKVYVSVGAAVCSTVLAFVAYYLYKMVVNAGVPDFLADELRVISKSVIAMAFIGYGYLAAELLSGKLFGGINVKGKKNKRIRGFILGVVLFAVNIAVLPFVQLMDLNNLNMGQLQWYLLLGITGSFGLFLICRSMPNIPILTFYGQNSLIIMCTHLNMYVLYIALVAGQIVVAHIPGNDAIMWMIVSMTGVMLLEIPVILVIRIFLPFMLGHGCGKCMKRKKKE